MINTVVLEGRLTVDPVLKATLNEGAEFCAFAIAQNMTGKDGSQRTDYFDISVWGPAAKFVSDHFGKGDRIVVAGKLHTRRYEGRDGVKRVATEIMAREVGMAPAAGARQTADSDFEEVGAE